MTEHTMPDGSVHADTAPKLQWLEDLMRRRPALARRELEAETARRLAEENRWLNAKLDAIRAILEQP